MPDSDWFYHLTAKAMAQKIKAKGMTSALLRLGIPVANPQGAFVQNRKKMEGTKFEQQLTTYLLEVFCRGGSEQDVVQNKGNYVPFDFVPEGSNAADIARLDTIANQRLQGYLKSLPNLGKPDSVKRAKLRKDEAVGVLARGMLEHDKGHFLTRLAVQYRAYRYKIEETITASHIYFLKAKDAATGYQSYVKHLNAADIVVLRVHKMNLAGLEDDDSDFKAVMTKEAVAPDVIDVMANHDRFSDLDYRCDARNWQKLTSWS